VVYGRIPPSLCRRAWTARTTPAVSPPHGRAFFFVQSSGHHRDLHSFPTRRSSDLVPSTVVRVLRCSPAMMMAPTTAIIIIAGERSEEHTSELQSRSDLVCRLLLEKKKKNQPSRRHVCTA